MVKYSFEFDTGHRKVSDSQLKFDQSLSPQGQYCDICSQGESDRAHPITNAVDGTERWWQSPPLSRNTEFNEVNVTLDLGQVGSIRYALKHTCHCVLYSPSTVHVILLSTVCVTIPLQFVQYIPTSFRIVNEFIDLQT